MEASMEAMEASMEAVEASAQKTSSAGDRVYRTLKLTFRTNSKPTQWNHPMAGISTDYNI